MTRRRSEDSTEQLIASVSARVRAPDTLRARIAQQRRDARRRRRRASVAGVCASAVVLLLLAAIMSASQDPLSVREVAAAALDPPTRPAPGHDPADQALLDIRVDGLAFPDWQEPWGWTAVGVRSENVDGRKVVTVTYSDGRRRVHYSIVAGRPLPWPGRGRVVRERDPRIVALDGDGVEAVTWRQDTRTCVLASRSVAAHRLADFAGWR